MMDCSVMTKTTNATLHADAVPVWDRWLIPIYEHLAQWANRLRDLTPRGGRGGGAHSEALSEQVLADANAMLGSGYLQAGQYEQAIEALNNAIRHDPEFAKAYFLLGMTRDCLQEYAAAIGHYSQAIAMRPDKASYYFCRGRAYEAMRRPLHALEDYSRVLMLEPGHQGARACQRQLEKQYLIGDAQRVR